MTTNCWVMGTLSAMDKDHFMQKDELENDRRVGRGHERRGWGQTVEYGGGLRSNSLYYFLNECCFLKQFFR